MQRGAIAGRLSFWEKRAEKFFCFLISRKRFSAVHAVAVCNLAEVFSLQEAAGRCADDTEFLVRKEGKYEKYACLSLDFFIIMEEKSI